MDYSISQLLDNLWHHMVVMDATINASASLSWIQVRASMPSSPTDTLQSDEAGYCHMVSQWVYRANRGN